ncbi:MAG: helix-turn-helix domain-containing protein [Ruminococcaceae bacterium]|nr:helix-turn-helix domain-containing protein [Oscillospiraceae bacterium]
MYKIQRKTTKQLNNSGMFLHHHHLSKSIDIHWHEFYEIEYITEGEGTAYINEKAYELKPNTLLFLSPVDFEKIEVKGTISIINLAFSGAIISSKINSILPYGCAMYNYPREIFDLLLREHKINDQWYYKKYTQLVNCILIDVVRGFSKNSEIIENSPIIKALHFMDLNFKNQMTLEQISDHVGLTPTYFSSLFHQKMNTTFKEYLTSLRLDYAAKLLIISDFSSTEICYTSGFNDFSSFSRAFKKKFFISPSEYRSKNTALKD